jgi:hypothetical protein
VALRSAAKLTDVTPGRVAPYGWATSRPGAVGATALTATTTAATPLDGTPAVPVTGKPIVLPGATA